MIAVSFLTTAVWCGRVDEANMNLGDTIKYQAPNNQIYKITLADSGYTSKNFSTETFFETIDAIKIHIDKYNPAVLETLTLSNDNSYDLVQTENGFTSFNLQTEIYFETIDALKEYIVFHNPLEEFAYSAPNGREFTIITTDNGYSVAQFDHPQFFETQEAVEAHLALFNQWGSTAAANDTTVDSIQNGWSTYKDFYWKQKNSTR